MTLPEPYYDDGQITIFNADCRDVLPHLAGVDAVVTDPPFFMPATHYQSRTQWQRSWSDTSVLAAFWSAIVDATVPALKPTGHFVAFCNGDSYPVFYPEMYRRFDVLKCIVWDKGHFGMGRVWRNQHELIIAARWKGSEFVADGITRSDVICCRVTPSADRSHPVEKPADLLTHLIQPTCPPDGVVLDPFMGGGSTLDAARRLGVRAIGIEGEERYCEIAVRRLAQAVLPFDQISA